MPEGNLRFVGKRQENFSTRIHEDLRVRWLDYQSLLLLVLAPLSHIYDPLFIYLFILMHRAIYELCASREGT